jgi:Protein of unknown function (DUF559)
MPYRQPEPSPIEIPFWKAAKPLIPELEREYWIDRKYRVDFIIPSKKIVIELYGYQYHNSKEKLTQDAERERYLQLKGYQVIRFTGSEVHKSPQYCVSQVMAIAAAQPATPSATMPILTQVAAAPPPPVIGDVNPTPDAIPAGAILKVMPGSKAAPFKRPAVAKPKTFFGLKLWQVASLGALAVSGCALLMLLMVLVVMQTSAAVPMPTPMPAFTATPLPTVPPMPTPMRIPVPPASFFINTWAQQFQIIGWALCFAGLFAVPLAVIGFVRSFLKRRFGI